MFKCFRKVRVNFRFFENTIDRLNKLADFKGVSKTKLIEYLIYKEHDKLF